jgi:ABC-2 type transport system ATP-binding protein
MHARLGFALAVNLNPEMLLIDEVLAVGDEAFQRKCMDQIDRFQAEGKTILFVSHSTDVVKDICDRVCVLERGLPVFLGKPDKGVEQYHALLHGDASKGEER